MTGSLRTHVNTKSEQIICAPFKPDSDLLRFTVLNLPFVLEDQVDPTEKQNTEDSLEKKTESKKMLIVVLESHFCHSLGFLGVQGSLDFQGNPIHPGKEKHI